MFISIDLLGPKEMVLSFAQTVWKDLVDTYKLSPDIFRVRYRKKEQAKKFFFGGKVAFFSKLSVFNNLLGLKKVFS